MNEKNMVKLGKAAFIATGTLWLATNAPALLRSNPASNIPDPISIAQVTSNPSHASCDQLNKVIRYYNRDDYKSKKDTLSSFARGKNCKVEDSE
jgi:hypothetical protein